MADWPLKTIYQCVLKRISKFCHVKKMQNCFLDDRKAFQLARLLNDHGIQVILNGQSGSLIDPSFGCVWKLGMPKRNCMLIHLNEKNDEPLDVGLVFRSTLGSRFSHVFPSHFWKSPGLEIVGHGGVGLGFWSTLWQVGNVIRLTPCGRTASGVFWPLVFSGKTSQPSPKSL